MYQTKSRSNTAHYVALAAIVMPAFLAATAAAHAVQQPEDELIQFAQPLPYMQPFYGHGGFDDNIMMSLDGYEGFGSSSTVESLNAEAKRIEEQLKEAKDALEKAKASDDKAKLLFAEGRVEAYEKASVSIRKAIERAERVAPLQKKVDVKFENATVAQAAEALSRASGVSIKVDGSIPDTTRLTVEARKVSLATVLESVARQAGLKIEPVNLDKGNLGIEMTAPPMLRVNNTVQRFPVSASPWSEKWGVPPTGRFIYRSVPASVWNYANADGKTITRTYANGISAEVLGNLARSGVYGAPAASGGSRALLTVDKGTTIEITRPGTVTVVESAKNDKNEEGKWRTVYSLKNGELIQQSRTWEKSK